MRFHKNKKQFIPKFNRVIKSMKTDGTIERIINKYTTNN